MQKVENESLVDNVVHQFLCTVPLKYFRWGSQTPKFTLQEQESILNRTILSDLNKTRPVQLKYQKVFLKAFLEILESQVNSEENTVLDDYSEIHEKVYSTYTELISSTNDDDKDFFKHYFIKCSGRIISLKENGNLISEGTTGLRTWQAAIALAEWCIQNKRHLENENVLELGSGIGLTGITLALECSPSLVYLTDCHDLVLRKLLSNIGTNCGVSTSCQLRKEVEINKKVKFNLTGATFKNDTLGDTTVKILKLPWEEIDQKTCTTLPNIDLIIAADIVYDSELFPPLVHALSSLWQHCHVKEIIFACTERNKATLDEFCKVMNESFQLEALECPVIENFIVWDTSTVHLLKFTRK